MLHRMRRIVRRRRKIGIHKGVNRLWRTWFSTRDYKAEMEGLDEPPFDSDFGQKRFKRMSPKKSWGEWVERQKMLLNEYRLQPWTREAQDFLVEQMNEFFFGEGGLAAEGVCGSDSLGPDGCMRGGGRVHLGDAG